MKQVSQQDAERARYTVEKVGPSSETPWIVKSFDLLLNICKKVNIHLFLNMKYRKNKVCSVEESES